MSDDFAFQVKADANQANKAAQDVTDALKGVEVQAKKAGSAMDSAFQDANGRWRTANGKFLATGQSLSTVGSSATTAGNGIAKAGDQIAKAGDAAADAGMSIHDLVEAALVLEALHIGAHLLDGYTEVSNKIRSVTKDQDNFNGVMEETYRIAQVTRTSWDETAGDFQRLSNATHGLGISQREALTLQEDLTKATKLSGASSQEAAMTQRELMHAFETGTLTMREWKVIQRDAPALVNELKGASQKTGAELINMAHSGQLSAQLLIEWLGKAHDSINDKFAKMVPTIAEDFVMLKNAAEKFFGEAGEGHGIMEALGAATRFLVANFDTLGKIILGLLEPLVALFVIEKITALVKALSVAVAANPLGALLLAIVVGVSLLRQFGDQWETSTRVMSAAGETAVTVADYMRALWQMIKDLASTIKDFVTDAWASLKDAFSSGIESSGIELSLRNVLLFIASFVDAAIGIFRALGDTIVAIFNDVGTAIGLAFQTMLNGLIHAANAMRQGLLNLMSTFDKAKAERNAQGDAAQDYNRAFAAAQARGLSITDSNAAGLKAQNTTPMADRVQQQYAIYNFDKNGQRQAGGIDDVQIVDPAAGNKFKQALGQKIDSDLSTSVVKDLVNTFMDKWDAAAEAVARQRKSKSAGTILDDKGAADPTLPNEKYEKLIEKLTNELRGLLEATNPQIKAQEELAHGQQILNDAIATGDPRLKAYIEKYGGATTIMQRYKEKLQDQLDPLGAIIRKVDEHRLALEDNAEAQAHNLAVTKAVEELNQKTGNSGSFFSNAVDKARIDDAITQMEAREKLMKNEQALTEQILGPQKQYMDNVASLDDLFNKHKITLDQYEMSLDKLKDAYIQTTPYAKTFENGVREGLRAIQNDVFDVASTVKTTMTNAFNSINNAITDLVVKGEADWHAMVESMLSDLTKLLLKQAEMGLLSGLGLVPPGFGDASNPIPGNQYGGSMKVPGFAHGGGFIVGGTGGTDSQLVAFRASPNEDVTVRTPAQQRAAAQGGRGAQGGNVNVINVSNMHEAAMASMNSKDGEKMVLNVLHKNRASLGWVTRR